MPAHKICGTEVVSVAFSSWVVTRWERVTMLEDFSCVTIKIEVNPLLKNCSNKLKGLTASRNDFK